MTVEPSELTHPSWRRLRAVREAFTADASPVLARTLAAFLALHGLAHLAGTSTSLTKAGDGGSVELLAGAWTVSDPLLLRLLGFVWALVGVGFVLVAVLTWMRSPRWPGALAGVTAVSLLVVTVGLWESVVGVLLDVVLLVIAWHAGGLRERRGRR